MKKLLPMFLILIVCNISFSQEKKPEFAIQNKGIDTLKIPVFKFYPNPVDDDLFIIGTAKIKSVEIMLKSGKRLAIYDFDKSIIRMNVSDIKAGDYLLKVTDENERQDIKTLIVK
jgi:hypothetical protein